MSESKESVASMIPSLIILLAISGVAMGIITAFFVLDVSTAECTGECVPGASQEKIAVFQYTAWGLFAAAGVGAVLLRNRRGWVVAPPLLAVVFTVIASIVMSKTGS